MTKAPSAVVIMGAGLTGMSAAYHLRQQGLLPRVLEREAHAGGHVVTLQDGAYRFDKTGHLLHLRDPQMRELALAWIGDEYLTVQRNSMVWSHGGYSHYPYQANTFGLPPDVAYECVMGFLQAQQQHHEEPSNFEEFCLQHFGEGFSKHFMIPYNSRLWGVHPREITAAWCSRFVPLPKLEDVIAGAVGKQGRQLGYNTQFVYPRLGIGQLSLSLAQQVPGIEFGREPVAIEAKTRCVHLNDGTDAPYEVLINTAPLDVLCRLLVDAPDEVRLAATRLRCNPLWYLDVAIAAPAGHPYHWVYVPEEHYPFYRVGCYSNFSPDLAPEGCSSLYVELVDRREPDPAVLLPEVARALVEMGWISDPRKIAFARARKMDYAYVIFDHAYYASVETLQAYLRDHHIISTGRYGGWNYSSMEDALLFGRDAANHVADLLR